jgi:hypothetical protein
MKALIQTGSSGRVPVPLKSDFLSIWDAMKHVRLFAAALFVAAAVFSSPAAVRYVATTGADAAAGGTQDSPWKTIGYALTQSANGDEILVQGGTYRESVTNSTVHNLTLRGGYKSDWTRDLRASQTFIIPPNNSVPCFYVYGVHSNRVEGLVLTGGSVGLVYDGTTGGTSLQTYMNYYHVFNQLVVTNNAGSGVCKSYGSSSAYACVVANSLLARNLTGFHTRSLGGSAYFLLNCTIVGNSDAAINTDYHYGHVFAYNCIIGGASPWVIKHERASDLLLDSVCLNPGTAKLKISSISSTQFGGALQFGDPGLDSAYELAAGSQCLKRGRDLSAYVPYFAVTEDLYGTGWNGAYDLGCVKSAYAPTLATYDETLVAADGDDADDRTAGGNRFKTIQAALKHTRAGGVCRISEGTYTGPIAVDKDGIRLLGVGGGKTLITTVKGTSYRAYGIIATASNCRFEGIGLRGNDTGLALSDGFSTTNCTVNACDFGGNGTGVLEQFLPDQYGNSYNANAGVWKRQSPEQKNCYTHCYFTNNTANGIYVSGGSSARIVNSLFCGNVNAVYDNRCSAGASRPMTINCTIADNTYGYYLTAYSSRASSTPYLYNTLFAGNGTAFFGNSNNKAYFNHVMMAANTHDDARQSGSTYTIATNTVYTVDDPGLVTTRLGPYHLDRNSAAFGKGADYSATTGIAVADDLDGNSRKATRVDLGCYTLPPSGFSLFLR